jgi:peptidyl-prolyl cis-trans isomerase C
MKLGSVTLLKEPLLHFLLIGAALFGAYAVVAEPAPSDVGHRIVVTAGEVGRLASYWEKRRLRPPTDDELAGLIDEHIREEVLYREALALGLDRDDAVIRRLMRQKYEFVAQDLAVAPEPDRETLLAWYDANRERYRSAPRLSFTQVHFDIDRRGSEGERDARLVLASLRGGASPEALGAGDGRLLDPDHRDVSAGDVAALFGQDFADAVLALDPGGWSGPVRSGYGLHLVRIDERTEGAVPPFEAVEAQVLADWTYEQRQKANDAIFARLLERYELVVEDPPDAAANGQERP